MNKSLKSIIIVVLIVGVAALIIFKPELIGQAFAALAGGFAAFKAKLFNSSRINVEEEIASIETEHAAKRKNWELMKEEYDSKFEALKARMDYLDFRSAKISQELKDLDEVERKALEKNRNMTSEEKLEWLKNF